MLNKKNLFICILVLCVLALTSCGQPSAPAVTAMEAPPATASATETATAAPTPDPTTAATTSEAAATPEVTAQSSGEAAAAPSDIFPATLNLSVTREGETDELTAYKQTSEQGYVIYLFEQYTMAPLPDGDLITLKDASDDTLKAIEMRITQDANYTPPAAAPGVKQLMHDTSEFTLNGKEYYVYMQYPIEAAEGTPVLFEAMLDTVLANGK